MRKQAKMSDHCPKCWSKQRDVCISGGDIVITYECGSSRIKNGHYVMRSNKCEIAYLKNQLKYAEEKLAETEGELTVVTALLDDILPLAMGESCFYNGHPEADQSVHCCDWSPIVDRICKALGREVPETEASQDANCATRRE